MSQVFKSSKPCFVCKKQEKTVQVRSGDVNVPLCLEHMYERLEDKPVKKKASVKGAERK